MVSWTTFNPESCTTSAGDQAKLQNPKLPCSSSPFRKPRSTARCKAFLAELTKKALIQQLWHLPGWSSLLLVGTPVSAMTCSHSYSHLPKRHPDPPQFQGRAIAQRSGMKITAGLNSKDSLHFNWFQPNLKEISFCLTSPLPSIESFAVELWAYFKVLCQRNIKL